MVFSSIYEEVKNMYSMIYFNNFWNKWINNNDLLLNLFYYLKLIIIPIYGLLVPLFILIIPYLIISKLLKFKIPFKAYKTIIKNLYFSGNGITKTLKNFFNIYDNMKGGSNNKNKSLFTLTNLIVKLVKIIIDSNLSKILYYLFIGGTYLYNIYSTLNFSYAYLKIIHMFQTKLCRVSKWITTTQYIYDNIGCLDCDEIKTEFEGNINFKQNNKLSFLDNKVFKCDPSYIFSNKGVILKQFYNIKENPSILKKYISYIGIIDVWSSISLMLKNNNNNIRLSLPNYIDNSKEPSIKIEGFYNLMIPNDKTIKNNIHIGSGNINKNKNKNNNNCKNIMITGPNASGKSTFLKSVIECIIMAQTISLVPADKMEFTPFHYINTYLNIPDCQGKESLFQAEMNRCYQQIEAFKDIKPNEFVFSIMDEIFVSTNYFEGLSGAYAIAKKMASYNNSICIISTHFSKLSEKCEDEKSLKIIIFQLNMIIIIKLKNHIKLKR